METTNKIIIKVSGFGETRFMEATVIHGGATLLVRGFAAKIGRGAKVHCTSYTFTIGHVNALGAYVASSKDTTVLNHAGMIIGFWDDAQGENNAPAPTLEQIWALDNLEEESIIAANVKRFNLVPIAAAAAAK